LGRRGGANSFVNKTGTVISSAFPCPHVWADGWVGDFLNNMGTAINCIKISQFFNPQMKTSAWNQISGNSVMNGMHLRKLLWQMTFPDTEPEQPT
jgi:hypothetical protein